MGGPERGEFSIVGGDLCLQVENSSSCIGLLVEQDSEFILEFVHTSCQALGLRFEIGFEITIDIGLAIALHNVTDYS